MADDADQRTLPACDDDDELFQQLHLPPPEPQPRPVEDAPQQEADAERPAGSPGIADRVRERHERARGECGGAHAAEPDAAALDDSGGLLVEPDSIGARVHERHAAAEPIGAEVEPAWEPDAAALDGGGAHVEPVGAEAEPAWEPDAAALDGGGSLVGTDSIGARVHARHADEGG